MTDRVVVDRLPDDLLSRLEGHIDAASWSMPSTFAQTGVHEGYRRQRGHLPDWLIEWLGGVKEAWFSWIQPSGFIVPHVDAGPYFRRLQVCVRPSGQMWDADRGWFSVDAGDVFWVHHWMPHAVRVGDIPRVHVVADLAERLVGPPDSGFAVFDWSVTDGISGR